MNKIPKRNAFIRKSPINSLPSGKLFETFQSIMLSNNIYQYILCILWSSTVVNTNNLE